MPLENKFERCEPGDPNQCQAVIAAGQCHYKAVPGFKFCPMHCGRSQSAAKSKALHQYRLGKWQARVEEFESHESIKSLRSEIGIMKTVLEEIVQRCESGHDLILNSTKIGEIVDKIHRLTPTMEKMEHNAGITLDKNAVLQLADVIVEIIGNFIEDADDKATVADQIISAVVNAAPKRDE